MVVHGSPLSSAKRGCEHSQRHARLWQAYSRPITHEPIYKAIVIPRNTRKNGFGNGLTMAVSCPASSLARALLATRLLRGGARGN